MKGKPSFTWGYKGDPPFIFYSGANGGPSIILLVGTNDDRAIIIQRRPTLVLFRGHKGQHMDRRLPDFPRSFRDERRSVTHP